jgi:hypothetical protein
MPRCLRNVVASKAVPAADAVQPCGAMEVNNPFDEPETRDYSSMLVQNTICSASFQDSQTLGPEL